MAERLGRSFNNNYRSHLWQSDWRAETQGQNQAARCFLRIYIPLRSEKSSPMQPGNSRGQQNSIRVVVNYLNQQKHFICGLFDPPDFKANIVMLA